MSYILDALRRADAERERDPARGIHARPAAAGPAGTRAGLPAWSWPAAAAVLVAGAGLLYWQRPAPVPPAAPAPMAAATQPAVVRPPMPAVAPIATAVMPPAPAVVVAPPVQRVRVAATQPTTSPAPAAVAPALPVPTVPVLKAPPPALQGTPAAAAAPSPLAPAAERIFNLAELPADVQHDLPKLAISGGVYSVNAVQRMLIVGGQVMNEGAELGSGVVLEQIRPRSAVLRFRGYRYSVAY